MSLTKLKIGNFIEKYNKKCNIPDLIKDDVSGINRKKEFFEPTIQIGSDTRNYKIVPPGYFACNLMHVGRDEVLPIALNHTESNKFVSPAYTVFRITDDAPLMTEYFFMLIKSEQTDRFFWFNTDSSIRDGMSWEDFSSLNFKLPPVDIQEKYVKVYNSLLENQKSYENGLEELNYTNEVYISKLFEEIPSIPINKFIKQSKVRNMENLGLERVRGLAVTKEVIETKADMKNVNLRNYKLLRPGYIAFVPDTSRRGDKMSLGFNRSKQSYLVSSISTVFYTDTSKLLPEYLMLYFSRDEFDRYARFNSWGTARETFNWDDMKNVKIPIPEINVQKAISDIHTVYLNRKVINDELKNRINELCPILVRGAVQEASLTKEE